LTRTVANTGQSRLAVLIGLHEKRIIPGRYADIIHLITTRELDQEDV
jgi:hypothetical protein